MQIVIKMSKEDYELYKADDWNIPKCLRDALASGTPLKSGRWLHMSIHDWQYDCSECGADSEEPYPYCPNCGARMESEEEE